MRVKEFNVQVKIEPWDGLVTILKKQSDKKKERKSKALLLA